MRPMPCWPPMPPAIMLHYPFVPLVAADGGRAGCDSRPGPRATGSLVRYIDHRPDVLALQGPRHDSGLQPVDDLDLLREARGEHHLDDPSLYDEVVQVP